MRLENLTTYRPLLQAAGFTRAQPYARLEAPVDTVRFGGSEDEGTGSIRFSDAVRRAINEEGEDKPFKIIENLVKRIETDLEVKKALDDAVLEDGQEE